MATEEGIVIRLDSRTAWVKTKNRVHVSLSGLKNRAMKWAATMKWK